MSDPITYDHGLVTAPSDWTVYIYEKGAEGVRLVNECALVGWMTRMTRTKRGVDGYREVVPVVWDGDYGWLVSFDDLWEMGLLAILREPGAERPVLEEVARVFDRRVAVEATFREATR